jgi:hypothetical protein
MFKKSVKISLPILVTIAAFSIFTKKEIWSMDLNQFVWKNRLLFIFAPQSSDPRYKSLESEINDQRDGIFDRDLIIFKILENGPSFMDTNPIDLQTAYSLRKRFAVPPGLFNVILVGKDGGTKLRQEIRVKLTDIFELIDAMPMRREEIRQKGK